jgi:hypothetical protein
MTIPRFTVCFRNRQLHAADGAILYRQCLSDDELDLGTMRLSLAVASTNERVRLLYVLEGKLMTHAGTFGPGTFVWFPEGEVMEHGASTEGDVTVLFVTNKAFRIDYVDEKAN